MSEQASFIRAFSIRVQRLARPASGRPRFLRFGVDEQIVFLKRLALFLRSGVALVPALSLIREDAATPSTRFVLESLQQATMRGESLTQSMGRFASTFGAFPIAMLAAGEAGGRLHEALVQIAAALSKRRELARTLCGALIYPGIVAAATLVVALFLTLYAFPKILPLFRGFGASLPLATRLLIGMSSFLAHDGLWLLLGLVGLTGAGLWVRRYERVRDAYDRFLLGLPLLGSMVRAYHLALISRTLSILLHSGMRLVPALELTAEVASNRAFRHALKGSSREVLAGQRLSASLAAHPRLFPRVCTQLVATGESTGTLSDNFAQLADAYEQELNEHSRTLATLIEPALMLSMGLVVGFIALAIITPLYQITQDIHLQ